MNTYVDLAKAQAAETGRPAALILDVETLPFDGLPEDGLPYVSQVFLAQTPLPYVGDVTYARMFSNVQPPPNVADPLTHRLWFDGYSGALRSLVSVGDWIKLDHKGPTYQITHIGVPVSPPAIDPQLGILGEIHIRRTAGTPPLTVPAASPAFPPTGSMMALPYQIYRQPEKSGSMPMELA